MMRRLVLATLCLLIQVPGLCHGLQQTIYINPDSGSPTLEGYAKKNTTVKWHVLDPGDGSSPSFTVEFPNGAPCQKNADKNALNAYPGHPAECKIRLPKGYKKGEVLLFQYQLNPTPKRPDKQQIFFQHVGSCDPCADPGGPVGGTPVVAKVASAATSKRTYQSMSYQEDIDCTKTPPVPPLNVNVGDTVFWENPYGVGSPKWKIDFKGEVCKVAPTDNNHPRCDVTAAGSATYTVTVGDPKSPTCKFDANMNVSAPPAQ